MDHISGNESPMGSIKVLIDSANPDAYSVNQCQIAINCNGRGCSSKRKNRNRHLRDQIGRIGCASRPQIFELIPHRGSI
jgi:hypothetical protein